MLFTGQLPRFYDFVEMLICVNFEIHISVRTNKNDKMHLTMRTGCDILLSVESPQLSAPSLKTVIILLLIDLY